MFGVSSQEVPSRPSQSRPVCILTSAWREVVDDPTVGDAVSLSGGAMAKDTLQSGGNGTRGRHSLAWKRFGARWGALGVYWSLSSTFPAAL
jgi:hypothetical protein